MEPLSEIVYIGGAALVGALTGVIVGVMLAAEQILRLRKQVDSLQAEREKFMPRSKPEIVEINIPVDAKNIPTYGD